MIPPIERARSILSCVGLAAGGCALVLGCSHDFEQFRYVGGAGGSGAAVHTGGNVGGTGGNGNGGNGAGALGGGGTAEPGALQWSLRFGGTGADDVNGLALDGDGNIYLTGYFSSDLGLGVEPMTSAGGSDVFLAKLDAAGDVVWAKQFGDESEQAGHVVRVAGERVVVAGWFSGRISFGSNEYEAAGGIDGFVAGFDLDGVPVWSATVHGPDRQVFYDIGLSDDGLTTYAIGVAETSATIGTGPVQLVQGMEDVVLARFDATGDSLGSRVVGDQFNQVGRCIVPTAEGVMVAGSFGVSMPMGCSDTPTSAGNGDTFVAGLTDSFQCQWISSYGNAAGFQEPDELVAVDSTQLVLVGRYQDAIDFGQGAHLSEGSFDIFRALFISTGEVVDSYSYGGNFGDRASGLAARSGGSVVLTGFHNGGIDFGNGTPYSAIGVDAYVVKLAGQNEHVWSHSFAAQGEQRGRAVAMDDQGAVNATGSFEGSFDMGGGELVSAGETDIFVARFAP